MKGLAIAVVAFAAIGAAVWALQRPFRTQDVSCNRISNLLPCVCSQKVQSFSAPVTLNTMAYRGGLLGVVHGLSREDGSAYDRYFSYSNGIARTWESDNTEGIENEILEPHGLFRSLSAYADCRFVLKGAASDYGIPDIGNIKFIHLD